MKENDDRLRGLLRQWTEIELPPDFEARVWRQIRTPHAPPARAWRPADWWRELVWQPAFAVGAAVLVAALIGAEVGWHAGPRPAALPGTYLTVDTLAGSYLRTLEGGR